MKTLKIQLLTQLLFSLTLLSSVNAFEWTTVSPSAAPRFEGMSAVVNDKMYVFTGLKNNGVFEHQFVCEVYDPALDNWTTLSPIPIPVTHEGIAVVGDDVWLVGGFNSSGIVIADVQIYNTVTNSWRMGPPMPANRGGGAAVKVGQNLHFFAGLLPDRNNGSTDHFVLDLNDQSAGWSNAAPMPEPRNHLSGVVIDGKIYAVGGQINHNGPQPRIDKDFLHVYDPNTNVWTELANLPAPRSHFEPGTFVYDGKIYCVGGKSISADGITDITEYDPANDTWTKIGDLPVPLFAPAAKVINSELIVACGGLNEAQYPQTTTYKAPFPPGNTGGGTENNITITAPADGAIFQAPANFTIEAEAISFGGGPTHLRVDNPSSGWRKLKLGYDPNSIWINPQNVTAGGNNKLEITLKDFTGLAEWDKIQIRPQGYSSNPINLANYINAAGGASDWTTITIPLSDFPAGVPFSQINYMEFPYSAGASAFDIGISEIKFTGGSSSFLWWGETKNDNAHDGDGVGGHMLATLVIGSGTTGAISQVEFYNGNSLLGVDLTAPYSFSWANVPEDTYTLTAKAINDANDSRTSDPIEIEVENNVNTDCNNEPNGTAQIDDCGICSGGNTGHIANDDKDDCGVCFGNNEDKDCNGDCFGSAFMDNCGVCVGGNTGIFPCATDCNGDPGGIAFIDDCNTCSGGNTGHIANDDKDDCGVCFGNNEDKDCNGDCFGNAFIDNCGVCVGGNTGVSPCATDCNGDPGGSAFIDNCGVCAGGNTGITPGNSCAGDCDLRVDGLMLVEAGSSNDIRLLTNGSVVNLNVEGDINLKAVLCSEPVGSVKFNLNGQQKIENISPYAFAGDNGGIYKVWTATPGVYIVQITAYSDRGGSGIPGQTFSVSFTIVDQDADCNGDEGGSAFFDDCGICSGGNSGHVANSEKDDCGECFGDNSSCCITHSDCDDGNPCTADFCESGNCIYSLLTGCCQDNNDCDDGNPCTEDICDKDAGCINIPVVGNEPSYLQVINLGTSWRKLKLGYDPNSIWINPQDVAASGNNELCITLREVTGFTNWNQVEIRPQGKTPAAVIGNYLPPGGIGNTWTEVCIPLSDFPTVDFSNLTYIAIPYSNGAGAFEINLQRVEFKGGIHFTWFGDPKTDNSHDGQSGTGSALYAELVEGTPCSSAAKTSIEDLPETLKIYPNPTNSRVNIDLTGFPQDNYSISLINYSGQRVFHAVMSDQLIQLNVTDFAAGIYLIEVQGALHILRSRLMIVE